MKQKLTITVDEAVVNRAKEQARRQRLSLSQLVENALREVTEVRGSSFSSRWRGRFRPAERGDDLSRALARKHL